MNLGTDFVGVITAKLIKQSYRYHKLRKAVSKFYRRHFKMIEKHHISLKTLTRQSISILEAYGGIVYKFKRIIGNPNFSDIFKRIVNRFKRARNKLDIMRQTACLVFNITYTSVPLPSRPLDTSAPSHFGPRHIGPYTVTSAPILSSQPLVISVLFS